jgi:hypothetical protein
MSTKRSFPERETGLPGSCQFTLTACHVGARPARGTSRRRGRARASRCSGSPPVRTTATTNRSMCGLVVHHRSVRGRSLAQLDRQGRAAT